MISDTDRLIDIIEDCHSYEIVLRMFLEAAETHELPPEGILPVFHDSVVGENVKTALELAVGKKYAP